MNVGLEVVLAVGAPLLGWTVYVTWALRRIVWMNEHPERTGVGQMLRANTRAIKEVAHYIRWMAEQNAGSKPPPYLDTDT